MIRVVVRSNECISRPSPAHTHTQFLLLFLTRERGLPFLGTTEQTSIPFNSIRRGYVSTSSAFGWVDRWMDIYPVGRITWDRCFQSERLSDRRTSEWRNERTEMEFACYMLYYPIKCVKFALTSHRVWLDNCRSAINWDHVTLHLNSAIPPAPATNRIEDNISILRWSRDRELFIKYIIFKSCSAESGEIREWGGVGGRWWRRVMTISIKKLRINRSQMEL